MFRLFDWIKVGAGALVVAGVTFGVMSAWTTLVIIPAERPEAAALAEAKARRAHSTSHRGDFVRC